MASEVLLDKDVLSKSQFRASSIHGSEIDYRNFLSGIKPHVKAGNVNSEILPSANLRPSSSIVLDPLETSIVAEQRALFPVKPKIICDLNYPPSNIRPALADPVSDRETRKQTEVSSAKHASMHKSKNLDLDSLKHPRQTSKPPSVNQLRSLFDQEKDSSATESVQPKVMKVAHPSTSLSTSFEGHEVRIKLPVLGIHQMPSAKTKSAEINPTKWAAMRLEDHTKIEELERESHAVVKSALVSTKLSDIIHHAGQRGEDSSSSELEEINGEMHHKVPESSKKGTHGILARKTSECDKIEENVVIRGSTEIDVSSILGTADENHNILYEIPSKEAQEFADSSSEVSQKSENKETQNPKLIEKEENIIVIGDKIIKRRSLAERLNAIVNGEESFLFSSPDYVFLTDYADSNKCDPRNLPVKSSKSYKVCIEEPFVLDVPNNTSEHAMPVTSASNLTSASENPQVQNQPNGIDDSVNEKSTIEKHDNPISKEPYISKAHAIKEEVPPAYQSLCSTREVTPVIQNDLRADETVRHAKAISEKLLTGSELVKAMAGVNICEEKNYGLMGPDTELRANEFLNPEKDFEDHVSDSEVGYFEAAPDKPVGETDSKQELGVESPTAANASLLGRMLIDLPGSSASDFLPSKHSNVSPKVSDASTASLQSIDSGEDFYLPPPPEKSALRKTSHEERRNVNFADATKEVILTYSPWEYDRANLEIDPVAASAEWELEKRVESMDVFSVDLNKDERGLGLSIIGLGVGSDTGLEKLGIFVKTLTPNGAAERDGRIQVNDQILEVNGVSLVGVTQQFAAFTLKGASGTVRFLMGREKSRRHYFSPGSTGSKSDIGVLEQKHNEELNEVIMQLQEMEERALVAENTLDEVKYALLQAEERAHASDDQVKELQEKMAAMAEQHSKDKDDEIDELQRSLQDITVRLTASEENLLAMQAAAEEKEDGIVELERKLRLAEDNLRQIEERNVVLTQEVKDRESQLAEMEKKIETHHVDYSDMIEQLDTYKERYQRLAKELDTIRAEASEDLLEKFALLEEANCSFGKEIVDLKSVNERLERQVVERDELVKKLNAENEYLQKLIVKLERSDVKATPSVEALTIRNVEQEVKIKQLEEKILFLEREKSAATRRRFFGELSPVVPEGSSSVRARSDDVDECEPLSGDSGVTDDSFERPAVPKRQLIREELSDGIVPSARVEPEVSLPPEISRGNKPHPSLEIALRVSASKPENCADASRAVSPGVAASVSALAPVARGAELLTSRLAEVEEDHHYLSFVDSLEQASESGSSFFLGEETPQTSQSTSTHNHVAESAEHDDGDFGVVPYVEEREDEDDWAIVRLEDAVNVANPVPKPPRHHFVGAESKALPVSHVLDNELKVNRSIMEESVSESSVSIASVTSASLSTSEASLDAVRINYDLTVPSTPKPIVEAFRAAPFSSSEPGAVGTVDRNATVAPSDHSEQPEMPTTLPSIRRGYDEQVRKSPALSFLSTLPETKVDSESEDDGRFGRGEASAPGLAVKEYGALESPKKVSDVHTWLHEDWGRLADDEREGHADEIAARIASRSPVLRKGSLASSSSSDDEKKTPTADLADEQDDDGDSRDVRWAQSMKLDESYFAKSKVVLTDSFDDALQSHSDVDVPAAKKGSGYHFEFDSVMPKTPVLDSKVFRERGDVREDKWKPSEHILAGESDSFQLLGDDGAGPQAAQFLAKPTVDGSTRGSAQSVGKDGDKHEKHKRFSIHLPKVFRKNSKSTKRSSSELASSVSSHFPSVVEVNVDRAASDAGSGDTHSGSDEDVVPFDEKAAASRSLERLNSAAFEDAHAPCANKEALMSAHTSYPQPSKSAPQATKLRAARSNTLDSKTSRLAAEAELKAAVSSPDLSLEPPSPSLAATAAFSRSTNAIAAGVKEDAADVHISNGTEGNDHVTHWTGKPANDWDVRQVGLWLVEINMGQYVNAFKAANIDGHALVRLDGNKLKDLGVADQSHRSEIKMHAKRYRHNASDDPHGKVAKRGRKLKFWKGKYAAN